MNKQKKDSTFEVNTSQNSDENCCKTEQKSKSFNNNHFGKLLNIKSLPTKGASKVAMQGCGCRV